MTTTGEHTPAVAAAEAAVVGRLSVLDRFLPVRIAAAMTIGLLAGRAIPGLGKGWTRAVLRALVFAREVCWSLWPGQEESGADLRRKGAGT